MTFLRAFWLFGPAEECGTLMGTQFLIWQADFLASSPPLFPPSWPWMGPFPLPSFVTAKVKSYFPFKGQTLSSVAVAIHEACWQGLFEECELLFFHAGRSVSQRVPLFLFREVEHFPSRLGSAAAAKKHREPSAPFGQRSSVCVRDDAGGVPPDEMASFPWWEKVTPSPIGPEEQVDRTF